MPAKASSASEVDQQTGEKVPSFWGCVLGFERWNDYFADRGINVPHGLVFRWGQESPAQPSAYCPCSSDECESEEEPPEPKVILVREYYDSDSEDTSTDDKDKDVDKKKKNKKVVKEKKRTSTTKPVKEKKSSTKPEKEKRRSSTDNRKRRSTTTDERRVSNTGSRRRSNESSSKRDRRNSAYRDIDTTERKRHPEHYRTARHPRDVSRARDPYGEYERRRHPEQYRSPRHHRDEGRQRDPFGDRERRRHPESYRTPRHARDMYSYEREMTKRRQRESRDGYRRRSSTSEREPRRHSDYCSASESDECHRSMHERFSCPERRKSKIKIEVKSLSDLNPDQREEVNRELDGRRNTTDARAKSRKKKTVVAGYASGMDEETSDVFGPPPGSQSSVHVYQASSKRESKSKGEKKRKKSESSAGSKSSRKSQKGNKGQKKERKKSKQKKKLTCPQRCSEDYPKKSHCNSTQNRKAVVNKTCNAGAPVRGQKGNSCVIARGQKCNAICNTAIWKNANNQSGDKAARNDKKASKSKSERKSSKGSHNSKSRKKSRNNSNSSNKNSGTNNRKPRKNNESRKKSKGSSGSGHKARKNSNTEAENSSRQKPRKGSKIQSKQKPRRGSGREEKPRKGSVSKQKPRKGSSDMSSERRGSDSKQKPRKGSSSESCGRSECSGKQKPSKGSDSKQKPRKGSSDMSSERRGSDSKQKPRKGSSSESCGRSECSGKQKPSKGSDSKQKPRKGSSDMSSERRGSDSKQKPRKGSSSESCGRSECSGKQKPSKGSDSKQKPRKGSSDNSSERRGSDSENKPSKSSDSKQKPRKGSDSKQKPRKGSDSKQKPRKGSESKQKPSKGSSGESSEKRVSDNKKKPESCSSSESCARRGCDSKDKPTKGSDSNQKPRKGSSDNSSERRGSDSEQKPRKGSDSKQKPRKGSDSKQKPTKGSDSKQKPRKGSSDDSSERRGSDSEHKPRKGSDSKQKPDKKKSSSEQPESKGSANQERQTANRTCDPGCQGQRRDSASGSNNPPANSKRQSSSKSPPKHKESRKGSNQPKSSENSGQKGRRKSSETIYFAMIPSPQCPMATPISEALPMGRKSSMHSSSSSVGKKSKKNRSKVRIIEDRHVLVSHPSSSLYDNPANKKKKMFGGSNDDSTGGAFKGPSNESLCESDTFSLTSTISSGVHQRGTKENNSPNSGQGSIQTLHRANSSKLLSHTSEESVNIGNSKSEKRKGFLRRLAMRVKPKKLTKHEENTSGEELSVKAQSKTRNSVSKINASEKEVYEETTLRKKRALKMFQKRNDSPDYKRSSHSKDLKERKKKSSTSQKSSSVTSQNGEKPNQTLPITKQKPPLKTSNDIKTVKNVRSIESVGDANALSGKLDQYQISNGRWQKVPGSSVSSASTEDTRSHGSALIAGKRREFDDSLSPVEERNDDVKKRERDRSLSLVGMQESIDANRTSVSPRITLIENLSQDIADLKHEIKNLSGIKAESSLGLDGDSSLSSIAPTMSHHSSGGALRAHNVQPRPTLVRSEDRSPDLERSSLYGHRNPNNEPKQRRSAPLTLSYPPDGRLPDDIWRTNESVLAMRRNELSIIDMMGNNLNEGLSQLPARSNYNIENISNANRRRMDSPLIDYSRSNMAEFNGEPRRSDGNSTDPETLLFGASLTSNSDNSVKRNIKLRNDFSSDDEGIRPRMGYHFDSDSNSIKTVSDRRLEGDDDATKRFASYIYNQRDAHDDRDRVERLDVPPTDTISNVKMYQSLAKRQSLMKGASSNGVQYDDGMTRSSIRLYRYTAEDKMLPNTYDSYSDRPTTIYSHVQTPSSTQYATCFTNMNNRELLQPGCSYPTDQCFIRSQSRYYKPDDGSDYNCDRTSEELPFAGAKRSHQVTFSPAEGTQALFEQEIFQTDGEPKAGVKRKYPFTAEESKLSGSFGDKKSSSYCQSNVKELSMYDKKLRDELGSGSYDNSLGNSWSILIPTENVNPWLNGLKSDLSNLEEIQNKVPKKKDSKWKLFSFGSRKSSKSSMKSKHSSSKHRNRTVAFDEDLPTVTKKTSNTSSHHSHKVGRKLSCGFWKRHATEEDSVPYGAPADSESIRESSSGKRNKKGGCFR